VIGRPGYRISKAEAMSHVFGVTLLNDLSAREVQKREVAMNTRFLTAKNMPGFGPTGPAVVTLDEAGDPHDLGLTCSVNGTVRMRVHTSGLIYRIPDILEHYTRYMPVEPGDIFSTGSAGGVAVGQPNAHELYLKPGDVVEVACGRIGTLRTEIVEPAALR
jgi:2-keto-4-pentenoate hydratase/2-oxohepta-3-ene-1,7-dioic acid hydratase in catechol pathway